MVAYVAFVAILNLWLGYVLGVYIGASRRRLVQVVAPEALTKKRQSEDNEPVENDTAQLSPETAYEADYSDVDALDGEPADHHFGDDPKVLSGIS